MAELDDVVLLLQSTKDINDALKNSITQQIAVINAQISFISGIDPSGAYGGVAQLLLCRTELQTILDTTLSQTTVNLDYLQNLENQYDQQYSQTLITIKKNLDILTKIQIKK